MAAPLPLGTGRYRKTGRGSPYGLAYGQDRLEAFISLGEKEIPAIIAELSEEDSLLMSLVENVARRHRRPSELLREIGSLSERGYTDRQIARKIGFSKTYVHDIRRLLAAGEERLLAAVGTGRMPLSVAADIAAADDEHVQRVLAEAYESGAMSGKQLIEAKRQVERRQRSGKAHLTVQAKGGRSRTSSTELIHALRSQAQQTRLTIKRAEITASRLRLKGRRGVLLPALVPADDSLSVPLARRERNLGFTWGSGRGARRTGNLILMDRRGHVAPCGTACYSRLEYGDLREAGSEAMNKSELTDRLVRRQGLGGAPARDAVDGVFERRWRMGGNAGPWIRHLSVPGTVRRAPGATCAMASRLRSRPRSRRSSRPARR